MVRDAQLEFQREEYPRAGGKQESIRTAQTLLPALNLTYCITGLSLRIEASEKPYRSTRMIKVCGCLNVYNMISKGASKVNTFKEIAVTKGIVWRYLAMHLLGFWVSVRWEHCQRPHWLYTKREATFSTSIRWKGSVRLDQVWSKVVCIRVFTTTDVWKSSTISKQLLNSRLTRLSSKSLNWLWVTFTNEHWFDWTKPQQVCLSWSCCLLTATQQRLSCKNTKKTLIKIFQYCKHKTTLVNNDAHCWLDTLIVN